MIKAKISLIFDQTMREIKMHIHFPLPLCPYAPMPLSLRPYYPLAFTKKQIANTFLSLTERMLNHIL